MRVWWIAILLLPGCLSDGPEAPLDDVAAASSFTFGAPEVIGVGADVESSLLVEGDIWLTCSHGGFYQPSPLWASTDAGATFGRIDPQPNPLVSGDCDLAILDSGRWVIVYDTIASATIAWSDDDGATWGFQYAAALPIAVDRPWIAAAGDVLYMTYSDVMAAEPALQMFARSDDGGLTWTGHTPVNVAQPPDRIQAVIGKMVLSDDGQTIHVPLARSNILLGGPTSLDMAVSRDAGATWSIEEVYGPFEPNGLVLPVAAWSGDDLVHVLSLPNGTDTDIHVLRGDEAVSVASGVDLPGLAGPWMDARDDGALTLAWVEHVDAGWTVSAARLHSDGRVEGPIHLAEPTDGDQGIGHEFIMLDHTDDGRAVVTWPMNTGPECDPAPNPAESRGSQCLWMAVETR